jgi:hypothetical protein
MNAFDKFLKERKVFDEYHSFTKREKFEWNKLYQQEMARHAISGEIYVRATHLMLS